MRGAVVLFGHPSLAHRILPIQRTRVRRSCYSNTTQYNPMLSYQKRKPSQSGIEQAEPRHPSPLGSIVRSKYPLCATGNGNEKENNEKDKKMNKTKKLLQTLFKFLTVKKSEQSEIYTYLVNLKPVYIINFYNTTFMHT